MFEEIQDNARCKGKRKESDSEELAFCLAELRFYSGGDREPVEALKPCLAGM